jgi:hypothetical protein
VTDVPSLSENRDLQMVGYPGRHQSTSEVRVCGVESCSKFYRRNDDSLQFDPQRHGAFSTQSNLWYRRILIGGEGFELANLVFVERIFAIQRPLRHRTQSQH